VAICEIFSFEENTIKKYVAFMKLEERNKILKEALEKIYEKDDVFMASTRRQNEENDNFIKLLQSDIQQLTNER
jgi:hypothetical protein